MLLVTGLAICGKQIKLYEVSHHFLQLTAMSQPLIKLPKVKLVVRHLTYLEILMNILFPCLEF